MLPRTSLPIHVNMTDSISRRLLREWEEDSKQKRGKQPEKDADYLRVGEQRLFPSWERSVDGVTEYAAARPQHEQADTEEKARFGQQSVIEIAVSSHA